MMSRRRCAGCATRSAGVRCDVSEVPDKAGKTGRPSSERSGSEQSGPELARAAVEAAMAKHRGKPRRKYVSDSQSRRRGYTGPGPDPRDPQPFGVVLERL